jgi:shikimate dehydrogenase
MFQQLSGATRLYPTAFAYCATSSERASLLGVVSVMRRNSDGTWHGEMLDEAGARELVIHDAHRSRVLAPSTAPVGS